MFSSVSDAIEVLRKASREGKRHKELTDTVDSVATNLRLLNNTLSANSKIFDKLVSTVRGPLQPLYHAFPSEALQLSAASFSFIFNQKIVNEITAGNKVLKANWEKVADSLLSGVLDFLEDQENAVAFESIASAMYPTLCSICFSPAFAASITSGTIGLKVTAFTLLSEAAEYPANRIKLRDSKILGGRRIGFALYGSKEYLVLESLLSLIARLVSLPREARAQRTSFIQDVFMGPCPEGLGCANELVETFSSLGKDDLDDLLSRSFDILAKSNIFFPQPFGVDQIDACTVVFPQKSPHEMFFIDYQCFLAMISEGDKLQAFRIPFTAICQITCSPHPETGLTRVAIQTTSPPELGQLTITLPMGQSLITVVELANEDIERFTRALGVRGLDGLIGCAKSQKPPPRLSIGHTTPLTFGSDGNALADAPSYREKVTNIGRAMELDNASDDISETPVHTSERHPQTPNAPFSRQNAQASTFVPFPLENASASNSDLTSGGKPVMASAPPMIALTPTMVPSKHPAAPPTPSQTKIVQKSVFGCSGDGLSEISDDAHSLKSLSQRYPRNGKNSNSSVPVTETNTATVDATGRRIIDSDDEIVANRRQTSSSVKETLMHMDESDEETLQAAKAIVVKHEQTRKNPVTPAAKGPQSLGRIESVSPISSPADHSEDEFDYKESQKSYRRSISVKPRKATLPQKLGTRPKPAPAPLIQAKKRKRSQDHTGGMETCGPVDDAPLAKRLRSKSLKENKFADPELPTDSQVLRKPRSIKANKYGTRKKKGASSAAAPSKVDEQVDYDKVPIAPGANTPSFQAGISTVSEISSTIATRTRAAAMKNKKNGPAATKAKPPPLETKKVKPEPLTLSQSKTKSPPVASEEDRNVPQTNRSATSKYFQATKTSPAIKSSRVACDTTVQLHGTPNKRPTRKRETTPWETTDFLNTCSEPDFVSRTFTPDLLMNDTMEPAITMDVQHTGAAHEMALFEDAFHGQRLGTHEIPEKKPDTSVKHTRSVPQPATLPAVAVTYYAPAMEPRIGEQTTMVAWQNRIMRENKIHEEGITGKPESTMLLERSNKKVNSPNPDTPENLTVMLHNPAPAFSSEIEGMNKSGKPAATQKVNGPALPLVNTPIVDLTLDDSPKNTASTGHPDPAPDYNRLHLTAETPTCTPKDSLFMDQSIRRPTRAYNKVAFSPAVKEEPVSLNEFLGGTKNLFTKSRPRSITGIHSAQPVRPFHRDAAGTQVLREGGRTTHDNNMQGIVDVLDEIQEVMIQKISGRFQNVENGARMCKSKLLQDAVSDLRSMHATSASHFNRLVDLEEEYATRSRKLVDAYEENIGINQEICQYIRQKIEEHDRTSLVKKMPKMLTSRRLPEILEKYTTK